MKFNFEFVDGCACHENVSALERTSPSPPANRRAPRCVFFSTAFCAARNPQYVAGGLGVDSAKSVRAPPFEVKNTHASAGAPTSLRLFSLFRHREVELRARSLLPFFPILRKKRGAQRDPAGLLRPACTILIDGRRGLRPVSRRTFVCSSKLVTF